MPKLENKRLIGSQTPTHSNVPYSEYSSGQEAVDFAAKQAGLYLDEWQANALRDGMGFREATPEEKALHPDASDWRWVTPDNALIVPRQNGKGSALEALVLWNLFANPDVSLITWSAHEFKTAKEAFFRVAALVENSPRLMRHVKKDGITYGAGNEGIKLHRAQKGDNCSCDGSRLKFIARSKTSGRGFTGDIIILDEAFELDILAMAALYFTLSARPNPMVWYTSSAPLVTSSYLRGLCRRGRAGEDDALYYAEWCADYDDDIDDPEAWAKANPALGIRLSVEWTKGELRTFSMDPDLGPEEFLRERMGIWKEDAFASIIDLTTWNRLIPDDLPEDLNDEDNTTKGTTAFAVDTTHDRKYSAIAAASFRDDGSVILEMIDVLPGTKWLSQRLVDLTYTHEPCVILIDGKSPAKAVVTDLKEAGFTVVKDEPDREEGEIVIIANTDMVSQACGEFYDAVMEPERKGMLWHTGDPDVGSAIEGAETAPVGDAWVWSRKLSTSIIAPLVATTLAYHGLREYGGEEEELRPIVVWSN